MKMLSIFPLGLTGSFRLRDISLSNASSNAVADKIEDLLMEARASNIQKEGASVTFSTGLLPSWNVLVQFDRGQIMVELEESAFVVRYKLSTLRMLYFVTFVAALMFVLTVHSWTSLQSNFLWIITACYGWLFGANYIIGAIRFPRWLKTGLTLPEKIDPARQ